MVSRKINKKVAILGMREKRELWMLSCTHQPKKVNNYITTTPFEWTDIIKCVTLGV